jgi:adenine deaminase
MTGIWTASCATPSQQGLKPVTAIQMATINTAQHFGWSGRSDRSRRGGWPIS